MAHELLLRPVYLVSNLRQERTTSIFFLDINAMLVQLEFIQTLYASHRCKHRNFYVNIIQLVLGYWHESRVFKSSGTSHLCNNLVQWNVFTKVTNAATQSPLFMQRHKCATF